MAPELGTPRGKSATGRAWKRILAALWQLTDGAGELIEHREREWASATFKGARHRYHLMFCGVEAVRQGEQLIAALPDHEFTLPGQLVADAAVADVRHSLVPEEALEVTCELLVLDDL